MVCAPRIPPEYLGRSDSDLQAEFTALQSAISELTRGAKIITGTYAQGDGNKSVTYQAADLATLRQQLNTLAGILYPGQGYGRRRPLRMIYR